MSFLPLNLNKLPTTYPSAPSLPARKLFTWTSPTTISLHFDWSSLECFLSCNRSAFYKLVHSRTSKPRVALAFGAAMHAALEIYYKLRLTTEPTELLALCKTGIYNEFAKFPHLNLVNEYRTPEYCYECFVKYVAQYRSENLQPVVTDKPLVEFSFALDLGATTLDSSVFQAYGYGTLTDDAEFEQQASGILDVKIKWTGICDMLATTNSDVWLVDHKTTSILSEDFFNGFNIAMQPVGYVNAMRHLFPELNVKGFLLNVLACRKPTKTGTGFETHRSFHAYEQWHIDEWNRDVLALIEEFLHNLSSNNWPRKTTWCIGKYGKCPYFDVCSLPPRLRLSFLQSDSYDINTWKPVSA